MVEEYDTFCKDFRRCVHENQDQGNLDLGEPTLDFAFSCGRVLSLGLLLGTEAAVMRPTGVDFSFLSFLCSDCMIGMDNSSMCRSP